MMEYQATIITIAFNNTSTDLINPHREKNMSSLKQSDEKNKKSLSLYFSLRLQINCAVDTGVLITGRLVRAPARERSRPRKRPCSPNHTVPQCCLPDQQTTVCQ